jgi:hypothetical protein
METPVRKRDNRVAPPVIAPIAPITTHEIRRFEVPDVDRHGIWMIERLKTAYPHLDQRQMVGWLRGLVYNNEFLFLFQEHSVGLAQAVRPDPFTPTVVIWERFVWAQSPEYVEEAAAFYERFAAWGKHKDASSIVVDEQTDVPNELIEKCLGELSERKQVYARL